MVRLDHCPRVRVRGYVPGVTRLVALGALLAALTAATLTPVAAEAVTAPVAPAARAGTALGITSKALDVVMTNDGAAHVAYLTRVSAGQPYVVHVCRIPAGATSCTETASKTLPNTDDTFGPWIVSDGTEVVVAVGNHNGAEERTYASLAVNSTTFGALSKVANVTPTDVELNPTGDRLWITSSQGPSGPGNAFEYLAFETAPMPGALTTAAAVFASSPGGMNDGGQVLGISPDGKPVAFVAGSTPDFPNGTYYRTFPGTPNNTNLIDAAQWGPLTRYDLPAPSQINGYYDVSSGAGRMWLGYEGLQRDTVLRQYGVGGFGAAVSPDCVSSRFPSGTQDAPDVAISRTGDLLVTETGSNGTTMFLGFFHGTANGSAFSPYTELASAPSIRDVETAADPTSDSGGIVVWTADDIYGGPLSFARMPAATPAACPPPKGFGSTTAKIGGATVELTLPDGCVPTASKYSLKVKKKKGKGTVTQVVFKATGAKKKLDRRSPFKVKLKVKKGTPSGAVIKVKVKVTVRKADGHLVTKRMKSAFTVC